MCCFESFSLRTETEQISFHMIRHFSKSVPSSPSAPPFNHVLFCWKHLPPLITALSCNLPISSFSSIFFFFLTCFFAVIGLLLHKCSLVPPLHILELCAYSWHCVISLPALTSMGWEISHHWLPSTSTWGQDCNFYRQNVAELRLQRGSHSVGSVWAGNVVVTYYSLKWMLPPVNRWLAQTFQNMFPFKPAKCLLCP